MSEKPRITVKKGPPPEVLEEFAAALDAEAEAWQSAMIEALTSEEETKDETARPQE